MPRHRWIPLLLIALASASPARAQEDPEASPDGRTHYLGREIARTMHWTGASWLLRETRENEENGVLLREWLDVQPGQRVCDFGCGNGYHTLPLAEAVGEEGRVYAVDLQLPMLAMLRDRLGEAGLENVELIECTVDDPKLAPGSCDLVLMVDVYHELTHPVRVLGRVREALAPGGRLVLVEFRSEDPQVPIKPEHKMHKAQVVRELAANGFRWSEDYDGLPWQHALVFTVEDAPGPRHAESEVLAAFWRALRAGDRATIAPFLATTVDDGRGRFNQAVDVLEQVDEAVGDMGVERWSELRSGWHSSVAARDGGGAAWLARRGAQRERVEVAADANGRLEVVAWHRRRSAACGPLVAMNTGTGGGTPAEQVELVAELGFGGIGWGVWRVEEVRRRCEELGVDLWSVYVVLDVAKHPDPREEQLAQAIAALEGGPGQVWLALESSERTCSDPGGDEAAQRTLARVLEVAERHGVEVALYPHYGSWMERVEDAQRLLEANPHPRLGICFNLCHWLRNHGQDEDLAAPLRAAGERLLAVTINGADTEGADWSRLIQPLDSGTFDQRKLLRILEAVRFDGPVGLQGFGIRIEPREHLSRSMAAWRSLQSE